MQNPESVLENETLKILCDFKMQTDHLISAQRPDLVIVNKKKRTCRIKLNENEQRFKYLQLGREQKIWNMKVTVIPIVIGRSV